MVVSTRLVAGARKRGNKLTEKKEVRSTKKREKVAVLSVTWP